ncbi:response regulator [Stutzerimonas zhaodongensis]|uniref:histidine kinase n=1 Tax=Stutzerimonas zhaodongensis TaxID=1176257 RepID=A0A3M2HWS9_9GAMM|nr:ATP-binding protein [Stutzerimonas zhaodongensis]MCQ4315791.1 ATP-binding protein [Stutzerimonas zhaodongensis]RMH91352.1 response regulator [Stutzerimonas zhaodongensis]
MSKTPTGIRQWIWRAFVQTALIPLVLVEVVLVATYLLSNSAIRDAQIEHLRETALAELQAAAALETRIIDEQLQQVARSTRLLRNFTARALAEDEPVAPRALSFTEDGVRYSPENDGGAASFYSGATPPEHQDLQKVARLHRLNPLLMELQAGNPLIASLYFNSWDSYNHIYPWFDTAQQYPPDMNIPDYNFYYLANAWHNPARKVVWTDVYLDPAGHGWMMSAIAPVYRGDFLEGVVGVDVTVGGILEQIGTLRVPWNGYAVLVSRDLSIMALPEAGEREFGLDELTKHSYDEAVRREIFKPEDFRLDRRGQTRKLAQALAAQNEGVMRLELGGEQRLVAWTTVRQTGWHLLAVVDEAEVFSQTNALANRFQHIGYLMIAGLVLFYLAFFAYMWLRARRLSESLLTPIFQISTMMGQIGLGRLRPQRVASDIRELDDLAQHTQAIGAQLEHSESQRTQAQERLELVLESATDSLWEFDTRSDTLQLRGRLPARFGLPAAQLSESQFLQRVHPQDLAHVKAEVERMHRGHTLHYESEFRFADALGDYHWLLSRGRVLERDPQTGQATLIAGTHVDIDAIKRGEENLRLATQQAQAANQAKTHLISSISHELRTPLNAILGFAQLMRMDCSPDADPEAADYLDEILLASRHLNQLLGDILDWSSLQAERPRLALERVEVTALMRECAELVALDVQRHGLRLDFDVPSAPIDVRAEPRRLRQVLLNLLSNAIKYNSPAGAIRLSIEMVAGQVRLQVEDTGMGIDETLQARMFEPFQRLGRESSNIQGAGIGLSLCLEYAKLMGGSIGVKSAPGAGSRFWIALSPLDPKRLPLTRERPRIVYAEDDPASQLLVRKALAELGEVVVIGNGRQALEQVLDDPPELLLLDLNLPELDGERLLHLLRQSPETRRLPVIVLSAASVRKDEIDCQGWLSKPLDLEALRRRVRDCLQALDLSPN